MNESKSQRSCAPRSSRSLFLDRYVAQAGSNNPSTCESIHLREQDLSLELCSSEAMRMSACEMARRMYVRDFGGNGNHRISEETRKLPKFKQEEITKGRLLGRGGFGVVFEVTRFDIPIGQTLTAKQLERTESPSLYDQEIVACHQSATEGRMFIAEHCHRHRNQTEEARYAVKTLRFDTFLDQMDMCQALADLNVETRILSSVDHPNIIKLRAIGSGPRFHQEFFIVLDRLYDTLETRMKSWQLKKRRYDGLSGKLRDPNHTKQQLLWHDRILAGYELSRAVAYLHDHRIIHRDLKPQNIGFDNVSLRPTHVALQFLIC